MSKRRRVLDDSDSSSDDEDVKKKKVISDADSDTTDDDDEWNEDGKTTKKPKKQKKQEKIASDTESDSDSSAFEFNDGYDSDLKGDEEDCERLEGMTEKERETELFERAERREAMRKRFEIEKKIRERTKIEKREKRRLARLEREKQAPSDSDSDDDLPADPSLISDPSDRRAAQAKNNRAETLKQIKADKKRKEEEKKKKDSEKKSLKPTDVFSSDSSSDEEDGAKLIRSSDSSSDESGDENRRRRNRDDSDQSDEDRPEDPEKVRLRQRIDTRDDLKIAKVSRFRMAQWLHMPWFRKTVVGCYVRVNIGVGEVPGKNTYRIAEIRDCSESTKVYMLDPGDNQTPKSSTNKQIMLRIGKLERNFRLCFISNNDWTDSEFTYWKKQVEPLGGIPTFGELETKAKDLERAKKHVITDKEIEVMVKEKSKHRSAPVNFATKKTTLIKLRDAAETEGNLDQVAEIQNELDRLEETANRLNRERQKDISGITFVNDRIKAALRKKDAVCEEEFKIYKEKKFDPFTRRITMPILVSNTNVETKDQIKAVLMDRYSEDLDMHYESLVFTKEKTEEDATKKKKDIDTSDLYSAHDFDIDIDLNVLPSSNGASSSFSGDPSRSQPSARVSLSDYRARNNL